MCANELAVNRCGNEQEHNNLHEADHYVPVHYRTGLPATRLHTSWKGPMRVIKGLNSR